MQLQLNPENPLLLLEGFTFVLGGVFKNWQTLIVQEFM
jgi:hypothetical protein